MSHPEFTPSDVKRQEADLSESLFQTAVLVTRIHAAAAAAEQSGIEGVRESQRGFWLMEEAVSTIGEILRDHGEAMLRHFVNVAIKREAARQHREGRF